MDNEPTIVQEDTGFVPEPIPDTIADTEINGLDPIQTDEPEAVEEVNEDTTDDQPKPAEEIEETPEPEPESNPDVQETQQQLDSREQARIAYEQRQQARAERDYIRDQRAQIRDYEQNSDQSDVEERMRILEAKQYVDTIERNRQSVVNEVAVAQNSIPFFKSGTEQAQLLFQQSLENFANAYGVTDPQTGEWIAAQDRNGNDVALLPYLQQQAAIYEQAVATAGRQAQQSEARMRAKAVNPSNAGKVTSSGDDVADLLDKIGDIQLN